MYRKLRRHVTALSDLLCDPCEPVDTSEQAPSPSSEITGPSESSLDPCCPVACPDVPARHEARATLLEVFTWTQQVSMTARQHEWHVLEPVSLETGWDLLESGAQTRFKQLLEQTLPTCVVVAWPCTVWSQLQRRQACACSTCVSTGVLKYNS